LRLILKNDIITLKKNLTQGSKYCGKEALVLLNGAFFYDIIIRWASQSQQLPRVRGWSQWFFGIWLFW